MSIIAILLGLAIVGVLLGIVLSLLPMPQPYRNLVIGVVILLTMLWLLRVLGVSAVIPTVR